MGFIRIAAILGFLAVALGAFGAHALRARLTPDQLTIYHTAVLYHFVHALALFGVGILAERHGSVPLQVTGWAFTVGVVLFSGSLYALAVSGVRLLGAITPLGGLAFLVGWASLVWATLVAPRGAA